MDCKKHLFQLDSDITYLNCAYMSPLMTSVEEAGISGIKKKQNPQHIHGEHFFSETDELRSEFAQLINTNEPERCVVIPSVSYGMANVAKNLKLQPDENIVVVGEQFPSNVYPWMEVAKKNNAQLITVPPPSVKENRASVWNQDILDAITPKTRLVACGHIHWADGTIYNLKEIREKTRRFGSWLAIDATQSLGALPFDVQEIQPDALVAAGYKSLMGPYSIGMAYYSSVFDGGSPVEQNWINRFESENFANLVNYSEDYQPKALRYEVGEHSNFILVPMMLEALRKLNEWKPENIKSYLDELVSAPVQKLRSAGYWIENDGERASNLFGIRLGKNHSMEEIKKTLSDENIFVSYRGDAIRVSPNIYNNSEDMQHLVDALT